jgi:hypothetical protein
MPVREEDLVYLELKKKIGVRSVKGGLLLPLRTRIGLSVRAKGEGSAVYGQSGFKRDQSLSGTLQGVSARIYQL